MLRPRCTLPSIYTPPLLPPKPPVKRLVELKPLYGEITPPKTNRTQRIDPPLRLRRAIHANDVLLVARILKTHPSILQNPDFSSTGLSNTSLHLAASLGHLEIVKLLLSLGHEGIPLPPQTPAIPTPVTDLAGTKPRLDISLNEHHQTPLHLAALGGHTETCHLLTTLIPSYIPRRDYRGRDAIMNAAEKGHDTIVLILLTAVQHEGVNTIEEVLANSDVDGNTALHFASMDGHLLVLRTLLAAGADSERRNVWSWTPGNYSSTVQAEVYFKNLVVELERRKQVRKQAEERMSEGNMSLGKGSGAGIRMVSVGDGEEL